MGNLCNSPWYFSNIVCISETTLYECNYPGEVVFLSAYSKVPWSIKKCILFLSFAAQQEIWIWQKFRTMKTDNFLKIIFTYNRIIKIDEKKWGKCSFIWVKSNKMLILNSSSIGICWRNSKRGCTFRSNVALLNMHLKIQLLQDNFPHIM